VVTIDPFIRHHRAPLQAAEEEGLGNGNSPSAHVWRTIANPDNPL
jgi:hypothetical protein